MASSIPQKRNRRMAATLAVACALTLAACGQPTVPDTAAPTTVEVEDASPLQGDAPRGFAKYYAQEPSWQTCDPAQVTPELMSAPEDIENYQCTTLTAPMSWDDPESQAIELSVARYIGALQGDSEPQRPPLFYNLGGPGGGAVDSLSAVVTNILTEQVADAYVVVALDPRGVGQSSPIWCLTDEERDEDNALDVDTATMSTEEIIAWSDAEMASIGAQCLERNGDLLGYVDSESATRDFDMVRAVLGAETMDYLGFSYGTLLGALYADLFPTHVGRFVLDGILDPALDVNQVAAMQTAGMEQSLYNWIETCVSGRKCPLGDSLEAGKAKMTEFFEEVAESPLPTSDPQRPLTLGLARTAVIGSLYSTSNYPLLTQAMQQAFEGDGSALLFLADYFNDRGLDGVYNSNADDAFLAVNALDYEPVGTPQEWEAAAAQIARDYPILGGDFGFASAGLSAWPVESRATRRPISAASAPEMLLIGTTHDPATPYEMAVSAHEAMPNTVLLTVEGWNHTAYNSSAGACVIGAVDRFLLNGELPAAGTVCE